MAESATAPRSGRGPWARAIARLSAATTQARPCRLNSSKSSRYHTVRVGSAQRRHRNSAAGHNAPPTYRACG
jgi:hypothetical protein